MAKTKVKKEKALKPMSKMELGFWYGIFNIMDFVADDLVTGNVFKRKRRHSDEIEEETTEERTLTEEEKIFGEDTDKVVETTVETTVAEEDKQPPAVVKTEEEHQTFTVKKEDEESLLNNARINEIIGKYTYAEKILAVAILWMCGVADDAQVGAVVSAIDSTMVDDNMITLNSIVKYFTGKAFATTITTEREFGIDPTSLQKVVREVISIDILRDNDNASNIIEKTKKYVQEKTGMYTVIFNNSKLNTTKSNVPDEVQRRLEGMIGDIIADFNHIIIKDEECDERVILRLFIDQETTRDIYVDPGTIFGEYKVAVQSVEGYHYYTSNKDLIKKYIVDDYRLTDADVASNKVNEHQFTNDPLYQFYQVASIQPKLNKLDREDINIFEGRLNFILGMLQKRYLAIPRMRVKNFKDCNTFILVSDIKVNSSYIAETTPVFQGLNIKVNKSSFQIVIKDETGNVVDQESMTFGQEFINAYNDLKVSFDSVEKVAKAHERYEMLNNPPQPEEAPVES